MPDIFDQIDNSDTEVGGSDIFDRIPMPEESFGKNALRTALQIPQGITEGTTGGIVAGIWHLLAQGEVLDPEEIDRIKDISEREGIPFDEEAYMEAAHKALGTVPTVSNIASKIEEKTGLPLEPKTKTQKALRLGSTSAKFQPGSISQKATAGAVAPTVSQGSQALGVPEPFSELAGLAAGAGAGSITPAVDVTLGKTKPSGMKARQFEKVAEPREVPKSKLNQINKKLESDFREISDKIIKDSPVGETFENLKNDPTFKQESRELLNQAQVVADSMPEPLFTSAIKKEYADISSKKVKGISLSEYDKSYMSFMKEAIKDIVPEKTTFGELVEQYRKNNSSLSEYFEPGSSKALNRAKRDALLDQNRAIANIVEKSSPELSEIFKSGNSRWTKIMDAEAVDAFVDKIFQKNVDFKKIHDFFDKEGYGFKFKRALGEKGYKDFQVLMKDMLTSEAPYKMLKVAQTKGFGELAETAGAFILHPTLGKAKLGFEATKKGYKALVNAMLDKPQLAITWKRAVDELKAGDFKAAAKDFKVLEAEVEVLPKEKVAPKTKPEGETINVKSEKVETPKEKEKTSEVKLEEGREFRDRFMQKETGNEVRDIEVKRKETLKKFNEKNKESKFTTKHIKKSRGDGEIDVHDKEGKRIAGLEYSKNPDGIYIENVFSYKPGGAKKAFTDFVEMFPDKDIFITPMTEKGAKSFEKEMGIKIQPRIVKGETIQETLKRAREDYKLTEADKKKILGGK